MSKTSPPALVVGTGHGRRVHLPALRAAGFDVVGLVGADPARTKKYADANNIAHAFTDLDEAIAKTGAVAVTIATPPHTHAPLAMIALARGCHVLCEKPFAKDSDEARRVLDAAARTGTFCIMGNQFRMLPERLVIAQAIAEGAIGQPRFATIIQYNALLASPEARMPRWWFDGDAGGGWLGASGSHVIDQVRAWLGDFASVSAALPTVADRKNAAEDSFLIRYTLANGCEGVSQQTGGAWGPNAAMTRISGTRGTLWVENGAVWLADRDGAVELPIPRELQLPPAPEFDHPLYQFLKLELPPAQRLCERWRAAIETGALDPALATFADGAACMKVIDAVRASAAGGGALAAV